MSCGYCYEGDTCNHVNGTCAGGCDPGWKEDNCSLGKPTNTIKNVLVTHMVLTAQCHADIATKEILEITSMGHVQEDVIQAGRNITVHKVSPQRISSDKACHFLK